MCPSQDAINTKGAAYSCATKTKLKGTKVAKPPVRHIAPPHRQASLSAYCCTPPVLLRAKISFYKTIFRLKNLRRNTTVKGTEPPGSHPSELFRCECACTAATLPLGSGITRVSMRAALPRWGECWITAGEGKQAHAHATFGTKGTNLSNCNE